MKGPGISTRRLNLAGFAICAALIGAALYFQYYGGLEPCPLCIFQRVGFMALGVVFLAAGLHNPGPAGARVYAGLIGLTALAGAGVAGRHVWLQNLPPERVPECGPGLEYMLEVFPPGEALRMVFTGSGECAEIAWSFLGLSMPAWSLLWFLALGTAGVLANSRAGGRSRWGRPPAPG